MHEWMDEWHKRWLNVRGRMSECKIMNAKNERKRMNAWNEWKIMNERLNERINENKWMRINKLNRMNER